MARRVSGHLAKKLLGYKWLMGHVVCTLWIFSNICCSASVPILLSPCLLFRLEPIDPKARPTAFEDVQTVFQAHPLGRFVRAICFVVATFCSFLNDASKAACCEFRHRFLIDFEFILPKTKVMHKNKSERWCCDHEASYQDHKKLHM